MLVGANLMKCKKRASGIEHRAGLIIPGMHDDLHMGIVIDGEARALRHSRLRPGRVRRQAVRTLIFCKF
jgi:hypothetical protein